MVLLFSNLADTNLANTWDQIQTFNSDIVFAAGSNIVFGTSTGTQIGTAGSQLLAFYGATPIVQQTGIAVTEIAIHAALVNLGLITA